MFPSMALSGATALDDNSCSLVPPPPGAANLKGTFSPSSFPILSPFSSLSTHVVAAAPFVVPCSGLARNSKRRKKKNERDGDRRREKSFSVLLCCCWLSLLASGPFPFPLFPFPSSPPFFHFSPNSSNDHKSLLPPSSSFSPSVRPLTVFGDRRNAGRKTPAFSPAGKPLLRETVDK